MGQSKMAHGTPSGKVIIELPDRGANMTISLFSLSLAKMEKARKLGFTLLFLLIFKPSSRPWESPVLGSFYLKLRTELLLLP